MLDLYRIFVKVVELGSFSQAAQQLTLSPSAVSRKIDALEQQLQCKLFNRTTRQLALTVNGQQVLVYAQQQLALQQSLLNTLQQQQSEPQGLLKISVFESFGRIKLAPLLPQFLKHFPQVSISLLLDNTLVDLYRDEIDLAIRIGPSPDSSLRSRLLFRTNLLVCAAPDYLAQHGTPQTPSELSQHNCLTLQSTHQAEQWYFQQEKRQQTITVSGNFSTNGGSGMMDAVCQGLGICMISQWSIENELSQGKLIPILADWQAGRYGYEQPHIYALFKEDRFMNPALRQLIDFLVDQLSPSR